MISSHDVTPTIKLSYMAKEFANVLMVTNHLILSEGDYLGGPNQITQTIEKPKVRSSYLWKRKPQKFQMRKGFRVSLPS